MIVRLYKGKGVISSLIKWQTRGEYSHASMIIKNNLYEAREFIGVQKRSLTEPENTEYDDYIVVADSLQEDKMVEFLERQMGKPYDYTMVIRFITRQQEDRKSTGKWFCSELVFATLIKANIYLFNKTEPWEVCPDELKRSILMLTP